MAAFFAYSHSWGTLASAGYSFKIDCLIFPRTQVVSPNK